MTKRLFILSAVIIAFISIFVCPSSLAGTDDPTTGDEEESPATQDTTQSIPEMVDLGLSVKWASFNLGASSPEESGLFYQWGDIIGYGSDLTDGKHFYLDDNKWGIGSGKYDVSEHGYFIKHSTLALEDDAARVALGGKWRIPTDDEWDELWECSWELTTLNGVEGFKFYSQKEGYTDNWIFFPAVSSRYDGRLIKNRYEFWSSSLYIHDSGKAFCMHFNEYEEEDGVQTIDRCFGLPIRPVYGDPYIRGVFLDQSCIILTVGKETALSAIVKPSIAPNQSVTWTSSDIEVAMVDENGKVSAKKAGSATITVTTADGGKTDTCTVDVIPDSLPDHVDLGLSVKWRSYNLGASSPEETGLFYQWGDTKGYGSDTSDGKYFHWADSSGRISYKWCYRIDGAEPILAKYNTKTKCGIVDNRNTLEMKDDAARVALGGEWRIPTRREWENLWECCSWTWTTFNGVEGYRVQSRREGYTDNWIFLPVTGHRYKNKKSRDFGSYWSSSLSPNEYMMHVNEYIEYVPQELSFGPGDFRIKDGARHWGYAIRPILD